MRHDDILALGVGEARTERGHVWVRVSDHEYEIRGPLGVTGWCPRSREAIREMSEWLGNDAPPKRD